MIHASRYVTTPGQIPDARVMKTQRMRTSNTSSSKYSASPAQTPAIFLSARERISFFGVGGIPTMLPQREQTRSSSAMALPQALQYMLCLPYLRVTTIAGKMFLATHCRLAHFSGTAYFLTKRGWTDFPRFLAKKPALSRAECGDFASARNGQDLTAGEGGFSSASAHNH